MGNIFSSRSIADYIKKERRSLGIETVYNYLNHLEAAYIIYRVPRFDIRGKRLLETNEKYYLMDIGLSHCLFGYRQGEVNDYLENIILVELLHRGYEVKIGIFGDYEIDFIAIKSGERLYIQVCYMLSDEKVFTREIRPLKKIKDNYPKYILSMDSVPESNEGGIIRKYIPDWLIDK
jgi:predicted AAA+ superfamily ATPase